MGARVKIFFPDDRYVREGDTITIAYPMIHIVGDEKFKVSSVHNHGDGKVEISFVINGSELEVIGDMKNE